MAYVFVGVPSRDGRIPGWLVPCIMELAKKHTVNYTNCTFSVLTFGFNMLLCMARQINDCDYFIMCHDDITPEVEGLVKLVDEIKDSGCGLMSVVSPIKDDRGITSTALAHPDDDWTPVHRLTMKELFKMPETITSEDFKDKILLANTGLMVLDMKQPWINDICFNIEDKITIDEHGKPSPQMMSEDWKLSRQIHRWNGKIGVTRKIKLSHSGLTSFPNSQPWGRLEVDDGKL